jgi:hypothetical protein
VDSEARILRLLDDLIEDVGNLRVAVARLEERLAALPETASAADLARLEERVENLPTAKPGLVRDGGLTLSSGAIGAIIAALVNHFAGK